MTTGALALKRFEVTPDGDVEGRYVRVVCRRRGLRALIRTMLGLDLTITLEVRRDAVQFKDLSLFEETYRTIPITAVRAVNAGLRRPLWKLVLGLYFVVNGVLSFVLAGIGNVLGDAVSASETEESWFWLATGGTSMLIGAVLLVFYVRQKRLFIEFEYGGSANRLLIQRSLRVPVSVPRVREAVEVVNGLVVRAHPVPPELEDEPSPIGEAAPRPAEPTAPTGSPVAAVMPARTNERV